MSRPLTKISSTTSVSLEVSLRQKMIPLIGKGMPFSTQTALIDGVKGGLFRLEIKNETVFLYLNDQRFWFRETGLVPTNPDRRI